MSDKRKQHLISQLLKANITVGLNEVLFNAAKSACRKHCADMLEDDFERLWEQHGFQAYLKMVEGAYDKHFSEEEVQQILNFWTSPVGQKLVRSSFVTDCLTIGAEWKEQAESVFIKRN